TGCPCQSREAPGPALSFAFLLRYYITKNPFQLQREFRGGSPDTDSRLCLSHVPARVVLAPFLSETQLDKLRARGTEVFTILRSLRRIGHKHLLCSGVRVLVLAVSGSYTSD